MNDATHNFDTARKAERDVVEQLRNHVPVDLTDPAHLALLAQEAKRLAEHWRAAAETCSAWNRDSFREDALNYACIAGSALALIDCPGDEAEADELDACLAADRGGILGGVLYLLNERRALRKVA